MIYRSLSLGLLSLAFCATSAMASNVVANPGFELAGANPSNATTFAIAAPSAASNWSTYLNTPGHVSTVLATSTDTLRPGGGAMIDVDTDGASNGVFQLTATFNYLAADVYVTSGVFQLIATNNYGATETIAVSTALNTWRRLSVAYASGNEIALYASGGAATFSVDNVYAGLTPDPVPEPGAWAVMLLGFGLAGLVCRRQRKIGLTA